MLELCLLEVHVKKYDGDFIMIIIHARFLVMFDCWLTVVSINSIVHHGFFFDGSLK